MNHKVRGQDQGRGWSSNFETKIIRPMSAHGRRLISFLMVMLCVKHYTMVCLLSSVGDL